MSAARDLRSNGLWELTTARAHGGWEEVDRRDARAEARRMLARRARDRAFVASLRQLLATRGPVGRLDDHQVIGLASRLLDSGQLRVRFRRRLDVGYEAPETVETAIGPAETVEVDDLVLDVEHLSPGADLGLVLEQPAPEAIALEAAHTGTPPTFGDSEVEAQVAVLREAAAAGTPFCEECEKARLEAEDAKQAETSVEATSVAAEPADDAVAALDAPTQAAALRSAAAEGTPFCEECEEAKAAAAGAGDA